MLMALMADGPKDGQFETDFPEFSDISALDIARPGECNRERICLNDQS